MTWTVLRPGLVFAPGAYGGTAMLRGLAGLPGCIPAFAPEATLQVVAMETVAAAIVRAVDPTTPSGLTLDLVGAEQVRLAPLLGKLRAWLGLPSAPVVVAPAWAILPGSRIADGLGWLGWRSPMRTNALRQLAMGMDAPVGGETVLGLPIQTLDEILEATPATLQDRWFARLYFAKPALLIGLSVFCAATGMLSLTAGYDAARNILEEAGIPSPWTGALVLAGALTDLALAAAVAVRWSTAAALKALIVISGGYLVLASLFRADLWLDPLGAILKTFAIMLLAAVALAMMEER